MARGFGLTSGAGTTDQITPVFSSETNERTWAIWTYRTGDGGGNIGRIFDKQAVPNILNRQSSAKYEFHAGWSGSAGGSAEWTFARPNANEWHHLCVTYDETSLTNDPIVYVDGVQVAITETVAPAGTLTTNANNYVVGNAGSGTRNWDGYLAEFAIWDRALSADEVASLGLYAFSPLWFVNSLKVYLPMNRANHEYFNTTTPSITGTVVQPHPRIILPFRQQRGVRVASAPISTKLQFAYYYAQLMGA